MAYCTATDVSSLLRLTDQTDAGVIQRLSFSTTTDPTLAEVNAWIAEAEDYIEMETNSAFDSKQFVRIKYSRRSYRNTGGTKRLLLDHSRLLAWSSDDGDKVEEIDSDGNWSALTEGADYEVDEEDGVVILSSSMGMNTITPFPRLAPSRDRYRVTYRVGRGAVPPAIKRAASLYVARQIVMNDRYRKIVPSGTDGDNLSQWMDYTQREIDKIIMRFTENSAVTL